MALTDVVTRILALRRVILALERIATTQETQTVLLQRLVDQLAPLPIAVIDPAELQKVSGVSHVSYGELGVVQDYIEKVQQAVGRAPTEEEIAAFLDGEEQVL